ncbi:hypothetical protein [Enterococcus mundtii]|uniref:hypothetical protein n=1 Tax=Enterococcus mundtii TaxID=53346 RepID=UPI00044B6527|nr:hypothetical protein [Enterococcus mundtii]EYT95855.1 hypothetical protein AK89_06420 [Enterococcus mundtii CRL35]MDO7877866.1 hypothetical protein [Enterococcus mundtii]
MRTRRKLLNSALILGLTLGNLNDIVVQAVTAFHELGPIQSRQARTTTNEREKKNGEKVKKETNEKVKQPEKEQNDSKERNELSKVELKNLSKEEIIERSDSLDQLLNPIHAQDLPSWIPYVSNLRGRQLGDMLTGHLRAGIRSNLDLTQDNFNIGDKVILRNVTPMYYRTPDFGYNDFIRYIVEDLSPLRRNDHTQRAVYTVISDPKSGNLANASHTFIKRLT